MDIVDTTTPTLVESDALLYLGDGTGHIKIPPIKFAPFPNHLLPGGQIVLGDFNGDGKLDLAAAVENYYDPSEGFSIGIALGNGDGTFRTPTIFSTPGSGLVQTADLNGDGKLDLVALENGKIQTFLGNGDGTFESKGSYPTGDIDESQFTLVDMNGDKKLDFLAVGFVSSTARLTLLEGNGDGSFGAPQHTQLPAAAGGSLLVGDFDNDGRMDVMGNGNGGSWYLEQKPLVWLSTLHLAFDSQAAGSFSPTQTVSATDTGSAPVAIPSVTISGSGAAEFTQTNNCTTLAARGGTCTVTVQFAPASAGTFTATLTINHAVEGTKTVALSGTGI